MQFSQIKLFPLWPTNLSDYIYWLDVCKYNCQWQSCSFAPKKPIFSRFATHNRDYAHTWSNCEDKSENHDRYIFAWYLRQIYTHWPLNASDNTQSIPAKGWSLALKLWWNAIFDRFIVNGICNWHKSNWEMYALNMRGLRKISSVILYSKWKARKWLM